MRGEVQDFPVLMVLLDQKETVDSLEVLVAAVLQVD